MDWKSVFCQYAEHVNSEEGVYFLTEFEPVGLTDEELAEFNALANKLDGGARKAWPERLWAAELHRIKLLKEKE